MPYKDPEHRKENTRKYYLENREALCKSRNERNRQKRLNDPVWALIEDLKRVSRRNKNRKERTTNG